MKVSNFACARFKGTWPAKLKLVTTMALTASFAGHYTWALPVCARSPLAQKAFQSIFGTNQCSDILDSDLLDVLEFDLSCGPSELFLPTDVSGLPNLETLFLGTDCVNDLSSSEFGEILKTMPNLRELQMNFFLNSFDDHALSSNVNLTNLTLALKEQVTSVAATSFDTLTQLNNFHLTASSYVKWSPRHFTKLQNLKKLKFAAPWADIAPGMWGNSPRLEVVELVLRGSPSLPKDTFAGNSNIVRLSLQGLTATPAAEALAGLPHLIEMELYSCTLNDLPHDLLGATSHVSAIYWSDVMIRSIPYGFFLSTPNLRDLRIRYSQIAEFPLSSLNSLAQLERLEIVEVKIHEEIPKDWLNASTQLKTINLESTGIRHFPTAVLERLSNLEEISLSYNPIRTLPLTDKVLATMPQLKHVRLHQTLIPANEITALAQRWPHVRFYF